MRVALITVVEPARSGAPNPRGLLQICGASVARHQVSLALAMECQRIVCMSRSPGSGIEALRTAARRGGAEFHAVTTSAGLVGQVSAIDELVVIADGLLASPLAAKPLLEGEHCVLVQPAETGIPAGFERIDLAHAAGGVMRIPGRLVERLGDLPADVDAASALARIALQAGVPMRPVPAMAKQSLAWTLVRDEGEAHAAETDWVSRAVAGSGASTPGPLLARLGAARLGPAMLHAGYGSRTLAIGSLAMLALALGLGWIGYASAGLVVAAAGWVIAIAAGLLQRIEDDAGNAGLNVQADWIIGWVVDAVIIALVIWITPKPVWETWHDRAFVPLMVLALLRLLPSALASPRLAWCEDRLVLGLALALMASLGVLESALQALALVLAGLGLALSGGITRLTRP